MTKTNVRHRGLALMLVLVIVGMASLIGMAMLSSAALQAQVSGGTVKRAAAEYMAESAVETAAYYLQKSGSMPASWGTQAGYVIYAHNQTVPGVSGSFDIEATSAGVDKYNVTAVGRSGGSTPASRTSTAQVSVTRVKPTYAGGFGGAITLPGRHTFNGAVTTGGAVLYENATAVVNGLVSTTPAANDFVIPTAATINYYGGDVAGGTYTMADGTTGTPQTIASPLVAAPVANGANPGKVFYINGPLVISGNVTVTGTIIARGTVTFQGGPCTITINPVTGFPALVADNTVSVFFKNVAVVLNGVVWAGGGTSWTGGLNTGSSFTVNGALLVPAGKSLGSTLTGTGVINYVAAKAAVSNLTKTAQAGTSVRYVSWN